MTTVEKFLTDIQKTLKFARQNNNGKTNYQKTRNDILKLFIRGTACPGDLPESLFEYWENQYIYKSNDFDYEPNQNNINKLAAFLAFLENSDENQDFVTPQDWKELNQLVNYEAEDLPLHILQDLMSILVSHGAY